MDGLAGDMLGGSDNAPRSHAAVDTSEQIHENVLQIIRHVKFDAII